MKDIDKTKEQLINEISKLRQRIAELEASEANHKHIAKEEMSRSEAILSAVGEGISIQAPNFRILYQNHAHKDLIGNHMGELCYTAYRQKEYICEGCPLALSFKDGNIHRDERSVLTDNGILYFEVTASPLKNSEGKIIAGIEVVRDITKRKKTEDALIAAEAKFRSLVEQSLVGIYIVQDNRFLYVNPKAAEIFGYTQDEVMASISVNDIVAEEDQALVAENIRKRIEGEVQSIHYFLKGKKKDGRLIDVEVHGARTEFNGRPAIIGTLLDITERKKMETELQKSQKLESLGILAGGIAHDFNNILTAIIGNVSLAKMYAKPGLEIFDILSEAEKAAVKAKNLTMQLLTFSKGGTPVKKITPIARLIKDSVSFALSGSNIRCEFSVPDSLRLAEVDESQISQVIYHLIINAQQSMPEGGTINIQAENIDAGAEDKLPVKTGEYVKISIKDHGIGIPEAHLPRIFDPYFSTKQEGSGFGLATAYSIIKKHDGHIAVESKLGAGTTIHIYLPASKEKISATKETGKKAPIVGKGKILVMDDDEIVRMVVGRMLGQCGYEADFAEDGEKAIGLYKKARESGKPYDAVIIDLVIPAGMGGKETIKHLLEIDPHVKAIVSSGYSDAQVMANFKDYGFKDALSKPYEIADLRQVLHKVITGSN